MFYKCFTIRLLLAIGLLSPFFSQSQTLKSEAILEKFKDASIHQTQQFALVNLDLWRNFNEKRFFTRLREMSAYVKRKGDLRLRVRLFLFFGMPRPTPKPK